MGACPGPSGEGTYPWVYGSHCLPKGLWYRYGRNVPSKPTSSIRRLFMIVAAGYKWLMGPYSQGYLYVAPRHREGPWS